MPSSASCSSVASWPGVMEIGAFHEMPLDSLLRLLQLNPYPDTAGDISPIDYRATLALYERLDQPTE